MGVYHTRGSHPRDSNYGFRKGVGCFLWTIDRLAADSAKERGTRVLYISPLNALAIDVERNLDRAR